MILHVLTIALLCAAVAAFLILWYFWVKGKLGASFFLDQDDQVLFPFRYFSWLVLGLIVATAVAQVHFVRVSTTVHERMTSLTSLLQRQEQQARAVEGLKEGLQKVRKDMDTNFQGLRSQLAEIPTRAQAAQAGSEALPAPAGPLRRPALAGLSPARGGAQENLFAEEARAAHPPVRPRSVGPQSAQPSVTGESESNPRPLSMSLSRQGRIITGNLRVRKQPYSTAEVVEKLGTGQPVKVTEKRMLNDKVWFRVVTPSGRAGWVDYRYVKLEGNS
ncbi:MAG: SH3 domain-containing protein [Deltaproteobacteria bacterium]|nr:SH3 domain-containing protein [Deltaproteobacteria bacterium]